MKLVADANVLFALSKPSSVATSIVDAHKIDLISPDFALVELYKYRDEICEKSGEKDFAKIISSLRQKVVFVDISEYRGELKQAAGKLSDKKDAPYLALAQKFGIGIWSNDADLKGLQGVVVLTTKELIMLLKK